jgi:protoheme IX farnesyltransferase
MTGGVILSRRQMQIYRQYVIRSNLRHRSRVYPNNDNAGDAGRRFYPPFSTNATDDNAQYGNIINKAPPGDIPQDDPRIIATPNKSLAFNLAELSKARLSALVVSTTAFGFLSAGPAALAYTSLPTFVAASVGTAMCASSAATFNQVFEAERDGRMKRTCNRPLVTGALSRDVAAGLGCLAGASGGAILGLGTDPVTTALGIGNIGLYAGLYTYLKPRSEINTWIGAVVGAVPPVMGWTAAGGSIMDAEAVLLGSTLFLWQFPHFFALNWMYRTDYKRGGFAMVAVNDPTGDRTASLIKRYGIYLASIPFISTALEVTSPMFAVDAGILLNGYALHVASDFDKERSNANARKVFLTSLWYLPCVMMLFLLHSRRWHEEVTDDEGLNLDDGDACNASMLESMQKLMNEIQSKGRDLCVHEAIASNAVEIWVGSNTNKTALDGSKCPISIGNAVAETASSLISGKENVELKQKSVHKASPSNERS